MTLLIRRARVADPQSSFNGQTIDLFLREGRIEEIGTSLADRGGDSWDVEGAWVSPGWLDLGAWVPDPGFEQRETFASAGRAAAAGGFTQVAVFPNSEPVVSHKGGVLYVKQANPGQPVEFLPIGAVTEGCRGMDITEMMDMSSEGAVAFSDGLQALQHSGVMLRALLYVKASDSLVVQFPYDHRISPQGQMHEGMVSTGLGLQGIPTLAETLMVDRDLALLEYSGSRLHFHGISSAASVDLIRRAKARGARVSCSVPALNLLFTDGDLEEFDTDLKVLPPLRTEADRQGLIEGLLDGTIDLVTSNHNPREEERKKLEFPYADFGAIGLETVFPILLAALGDRIEAGWIANKLSLIPHGLLKKEENGIEKNAQANLTFFSMEGQTQCSPALFQSLSKNSPLRDRTLPGKVLGVVNRGFIYRSSPE